MTKELKEKLKIKLEKSIKLTTNRIKDLEELTKPIAPENSIGRVSRMDAIHNKSVSEATLRSAREQLEKLKLAFSKIDNADFGICKSCTSDIALPRLMAMPESTQCIKCARRG